MRSLLALLTIAFLSLGATACGRGSRGVGSTPSTTAPRTTQSPFRGDTDRLSDRGYDKDDDPIHYYGHAANAADERAVTALVKRYYAAGAAGDGARACLLLYSEIAGSVVEQYGRPLGPPALRGKTCAAVMSKLFKQRRRQLAADRATLEVTGVRVEGDRGYALLSSTKMPVGYIVLRREHDDWKVGALLGGPPS
jgi:hypothetical protein